MSKAFRTGGEPNCIIVNYVGDSIMNREKHGEGSTYSLSATNAPSCANELSLSLLSGSGVNVAVVQRKTVKHRTDKYDLEGPKKNSSMWSPL